MRSQKLQQLQLSLGILSYRSRILRHRNRSLWLRKKSSKRVLRNICGTLTLCTITHSREQCSKRIYTLRVAGSRSKAWVYGTVWLKGSIVHP